LPTVIEAGCETPTAAPVANSDTPVIAAASAVPAATQPQQRNTSASPNSCAMRCFHHSSPGKIDDEVQQKTKLNIGLSTDFFLN
jgi:hypothetical protein